MSEEEEKICLKRIDLPNKKTVYVQNETNFVYVRSKNGSFEKIGKAKGYIALHGEIIGVVFQKRKVKA